ncbi:hypothetical protein T310_10192 [Rasamsonia emersonii CBS 393.64]|uniref:Uncharacterized protein n=1 Tax=Rasamsonia emersonii (strain ATCC 16479 / CBS 393.64 / IMI 116815) TaxID=1408163 RepID=A0A0F4YDF2_RASE3|nr:hypothetical protein T310_10192 [Rasamsonia emersonii CBS 393.64]KKA16227.1 hypothetical protein T310_10192 [Rasamsonia emersonii CBS 393.64]
MLSTWLLLLLPADRDACRFRLPKRQAPRPPGSEAAYIWHTALAPIPPITSTLSSGCLHPDESLLSISQSGIMVSSLISSLDLFVFYSCLLSRLSSVILCRILYHYHDTLYQKTTQNARVSVILINFRWNKLIYYSACLDEREDNKNDEHREASVNAIYLVSGVVCWYIDVSQLASTDNQETPRHREPPQQRPQQLSSK